MPHSPLRSASLLLFFNNRLFLLIIKVLNHNWLSIVYMLADLDFSIYIVVLSIWIFDLDRISMMVMNGSTRYGFRFKARLDLDLLTSVSHLNDSLFSDDHMIGASENENEPSYQKCISN